MEEDSNKASKLSDDSSDGGSNYSTSSPEVSKDQYFAYLKSGHKSKKGSSTKKRKTAATAGGKKQAAGAGELPKLPPVPPISVQFSRRLVVKVHSNEIHFSKKGALKNLNSIRLFGQNYFSLDKEFDRNDLFENRIVPATEALVEEQDFQVSDAHPHGPYFTREHKMGRKGTQHSQCFED